MVLSRCRDGARLVRTHVIFVVIVRETCAAGRTVIKCTLDGTKTRTCFQNIVRREEAPVVAQRRLR